MTIQEAVIILQAIDDACMYSEASIGDEIVASLTTAFPDIPWDELKEDAD